jgi:hypothetical protein
VFQKLLRMVPRFTERLMEASDEESMMMADLVRLCPELYEPSLIQKRSRRVSPVQGLMIRRVSKALFWTG